MVKNRISAFIVVLLVSLIFGYSNTIEAKGHIDIKEGTVEIQMDSNEDNGFEIDVPDISGPVRNLPWAKDEEFLKTQEENGAYILMAAYCSVLIDPLPGESHNVDLAAKSAKGIVIPPKGTFSQNQLIGPYTGERGYKMGTSFAGANLVQTEGGGVCKIATTLYNVAILGDFEIVERHNHS
ncbi:MAG: VanW family protein, partial [Tissierellia bacterium]|nr:VanW family protein [Tissierellia bacterium]